MKLKQKQRKQKKTLIKAKEMFIKIYRLEIDEIIRLSPIVGVAKL